MSARASTYVAIALLAIAGASAAHAGPELAAQQVAAAWPESVAAPRVPFHAPGALPAPAPLRGRSAEAGLEGAIGDPMSQALRAGRWQIQAALLRTRDDGEADGMLGKLLDGCD